MFFSSLITPVILIVLYGTFLSNVYKDSFQSSLPEFLSVSDKLINGTVAAQLAAALLAVSCVTVTFCVNLTMIQDKANGSRKDFNVSPTGKPVIYLGYFFSTVFNSLIVNGLAFLLCMGYIRKMGWYLNTSDILYLILDVIVLVLFGSVLSSIVCYPLKTQGQMSAVGTIVSAGYGFICGAYMPISNFGKGLQKGFPDDVVTGIADSLDCNPVFRGHVVSSAEMLAFMVGTIVVLGIIYLIITALPEK